MLNVVQLFTMATVVTVQPLLTVVNVGRSMRGAHWGDAPIKVQHLSGCEIGVNVNLLDN